MQAVIHKSIEARLDSDSEEALRTLFGMNIVRIESNQIWAHQDECQLSDAQLVAVDNASKPTRKNIVQVIYQLEWTPRLDIGFSRIYAQVGERPQLFDSHWHTDDPTPISSIEVFAFSTLPEQQRFNPLLTEFERRLTKIPLLFFMQKVVLASPSAIGVAGLHRAFRESRPGISGCLQMTLLFEQF